MKKSASVRSSAGPNLALPRLSSKLVSIADQLASAAIEFGINIDDSFAPRVATIAFANGVLLRHMNPGVATALVELLDAEALPPRRELEGAATATMQAVEETSEWPMRLSRVLSHRWKLSADYAPDLPAQEAVRLRQLHAIRTGLFVTRECPEFASKLEELIKTMPVENRFLTDRLLAWSHRNWMPSAPPFVEFAAAFYQPGSFERHVMTSKFAEVYPAAKMLDDPWRLSFWVEVGWNSGRYFAQHSSNDCRKLLSEASEAYLKGCHDLYQRFLLRTARSDGQVEIEKATLCYLGANLVDGDRARLRHFTRIESDLYPQLFEHYENFFSDWVAGSVIARKLDVTLKRSKPSKNGLQLHEFAQRLTPAQLAAFVEALLRPKGRGSDQGPATQNQSSRP